MIARTFVIGFNFRGQPRTDIKKIEEALNADDWARIGPNVWLVHTSRKASEISDSLRAVCHAEDYILVLEADVRQRSGWLTKNIWDWLAERT